VVFAEYVLDCARSGKERNVPNVMISNGFINEKPLRDLCRYLGAIKIDLKAFTEDFYRNRCSGSLRPVLDTLVRLRDEGIWFEIVDLIIPGLNDSVEEIRQMTRWIRRELGPDVPLHFSRYYPTFMMKNIPPTPKETLLELRKVAVDSGIRFVYIGNILTEYSHTYCPACGEKLIERYGYHTRITGLKSGACGKCGEKIPGRF
jgi:pyruvate formate lyase activating enzyme